MAFIVDDMGCGVEDGFFGIKRSPERTVVFTDAGMKNITTGFADGVSSKNSRNLLCGTVERGYPPVHIDGKNAFVD